MTMTVTGIERVLQMANNMTRLRQASTNALEGGANLMIRDAKSNVHKISGDLERSIRILKKIAGEVHWGSQLRYAGTEEFRVGGKYSGSHAYARPAAQKNIPQTQKLMLKEISTLLKA